MSWKIRRMWDNHCHVVVFVIVLLTGCGSKSVKSEQTVNAKSILNTEESRELIEARRTLQNYMQTSLLATHSLFDNALRGGEVERIDDLDGVSSWEDKGGFNFVGMGFRFWLPPETKSVAVGFTDCTWGKGSCVHGLTTAVWEGGKCGLWLNGDGGVGDVRRCLDEMRSRVIDAVTDESEKQAVFALVLDRAIELGPERLRSRTDEELIVALSRDFTPLLQKKDPPLDSLLLGFVCEELLGARGGWTVLQGKRVRVYYSGSSTGGLAVVFDSKGMHMLSAFLDGSNEDVLKMYLPTLMHVKRYTGIHSGRPWP